MAESKLYKVGLTVAGNYVHGTQYDILTQVFYEEDGCSYTSIKPNRNIRPGTDATVWVKSSSKGADGGIGPVGPAGVNGTDGVDGVTPAFSIGTVTTGSAGSQASATITGTDAAPILNLNIPKGDQGNTGSSVDYPYELVNNRTTDDATKGLSAAEGKRLGDDLSQLETKVDELVQTENESDADFFIADDNWKAIVEFSGGHIATKNFDSSKTVKEIALVGNVLKITI